MEKSQKAVFWASLVILFIFFGLPIIGQFVKIEFSKTDTGEALEKFRFFLLPFIILCSLAWTLKKVDSTGVKTVKFSL